MRKLNVRIQASAPYRLDRLEDRLQAVERRMESANPDGSVRSALGEMRRWLEDAKRTAASASSSMQELSKGWNELKAAHASTRQEVLDLQRELDLTRESFRKEQERTDAVIAEAVRVEMDRVLVDYTSVLQALNPPEGPGTSGNSGPSQSAGPHSASLATSSQNQPQGASPAEQPSSTVSAAGPAISRLTAMSRLTSLPPSSAPASLVSATSAAAHSLHFTYQAANEVGDVNQSISHLHISETGENRGARRLSDMDIQGEESD